MKTCTKEIIQVEFKQILAGKPLDLEDINRFPINNYGYDYAINGITLPEGIELEKLPQVNYAGETIENDSGFFAWKGGYILAPVPFYGFDFKFVGKSFNESEYLSGIETSYREAGAFDTFGGYIEDLFKLAQQVFQKEFEYRKELYVAPYFYALENVEELFQATFLTLWKYEGFTEWGEYYDEWELVGEFNI